MVRESSIGFWFKGYDYFLDKFNDSGQDVLMRRILFKKYYILRGEEAAGLFYDQQKFSRQKATPKRFQKTLFGVNGVQGLDGEEHVERKHLFMQCMSSDSLNLLNTYFDEAWFDAVERWEEFQEINFFREMERVLFISACKWVGIPYKDEDLSSRVKDISTMISSSGKIGIKHWKGRMARKKTEHWLIKIIRSARNHKKSPEQTSIFSQFVNYQNRHGQMLSEHTLAVELLNLIRPIVAIARYMTFSLKALEDYPQYKSELQKDFDAYGEAFIQEVRRFYPFFPFVPARVISDFEYKGIKFPKGRKVLLDLYATNHYCDIWKAPERFYPERFFGAKITPFNLIPQGGGDHNVNHRCAGEWITQNLMKRSLYYLTHDINYKLKSRNLKLHKNKFPPLPANGIKISDVTKTAIS